MKAYLDHDEGIGELYVGEITLTEAVMIDRTWRSERPTLWIGVDDEPLEHYGGYRIEQRGEDAAVIFVFRE